MYSTKILWIFALLIGSTFGRPQNQGNPFQTGGSNTNFVFATTTLAPNAPTTAAPNTPTTASPQYLQCLQSCPSTMEYNPICGSDRINYHNNGRLTCAQRCGKNVAAVRAGTCNPLG